jgi:hypothetical protein
MLGTDPEIFGKRIGGGDVVAAYDILGGDIDIPLPDGKSAYPDGLAVEFNVTPDANPTVLVNRMFKNYEYIQQFMAERGFAPCLASNAYVSPATIARFPESFGKRASLQILGCNEDRNIYTNREPVVRPDPKTYTYRTLGGHIHIGIPADVANNMMRMQCIVLGLDATVGLFTTKYALGDEEIARRKLYGLSGTYRVPMYSPGNYGVEYRVPSAQAILANKDRSIETFALAKASVECMLERIESVDNDDHLVDAISDVLDIAESISSAIDHVDRWWCNELMNIGRFFREVKARC